MSLFELQPQQQQEQQPVPPPELPQQPPATDSPPAPPPQPPKFDITNFRKDELIIWKDENTNRCFLGSVRAVEPSGEGRVEVQAWGSTGRMPLTSRRMQPAWCPVRGRPKLLYSAQKPAGCGPELCYLIPEEVVERTALTPEGRLPSDVCETYKSVLLASHDTCFPSDRLSFDSLASQAAMAVLFSPSAESAHETEHHNAETATSPPFFLWNDEQQQASVGVCSAATTYTPLPCRDLSPEQLEGHAASREKELSSLSENDVYERVPIAEVPPEQVRSAIPTHFVDTMKRQKAGEWDFKSRVVADGSPFFDRREGVTTSCATASQWAMRCALAMAFAHADFDPREIVVADVKTAYLTALRSDCVYVRPPKDHPNYGKYLWCLNHALYGMKDSGNL
uniref:Reverse transcriptase Ty1/copia-type domain-containing protein n=1 Tax=Chromera velia CCMP2878 TaxID=1169474 RepID=A0A0G4I007_9ALVE|eukprot:Cvel_34208.t1-p1 / transcript=Cvel_34208.t1 / gene=Cvel_34208 / organism=Chromera_velia_CCMP2878 / gene_product=hypothetical protein / transcript_product=hypothetical protein / location=Cvel_scaffold5795:1024-2202(+) / protein_length=393 / sequence_SO=supercontig / SO=protein_coding / is_pseudo=false